MYVRPGGNAEVILELGKDFEEGKQPRVSRSGQEDRAAVSRAGNVLSSLTNRVYPVYRTGTSGDGEPIAIKRKLTRTGTSGESTAITTERTLTVDGASAYVVLASCGPPERRPVPEPEPVDHTLAIILMYGQYIMVWIPTNELTEVEPARSNTGGAVCKD